MDARLYCAVIADINKSRELERRARVQQRFQRAIAKMNSEFREDLASRFVLTIGDECQGLLRTVAPSMPLVRRFRELMEPVSFSFGIGVGKLSTPLREDAALGMDGEVFHRARAALSSAKKSGRVVAFEFAHPALPVVNALVALMEKQWSRMTPRQREIAALLRAHEKQAIVARKLGISQPAVSKAASSSVFAQIREAELSLDQFLSTLIPAPGDSSHT